LPKVENYDGVIEVGVKLSIHEGENFAQKPLE
jgi:hypothetical protein